MPTNEKEYMKKYFRSYVLGSQSLICPICSGKYKSYNRHIHRKTKKHIDAENKRD